MTIDLINLNQVTVSADQTQTSIGPGNRWYDVYSKLERMGLSVIGGRVSDIGVGGLTLGGGISFFSGRFGWACDNVNTYEVGFVPLIDPRKLKISRLFSPMAPFTMSAIAYILTCTLRFAVAGITLV